MAKAIVLIVPDDVVANGFVLYAGQQLLQDFKHHNRTNMNTTKVADLKSSEVELDWDKSKEQRGEIELIHTITLK